MGPYLEKNWTHECITVLWKPLVDVSHVCGMDGHSLPAALISTVPLPYLVFGSPLIPGSCAKAPSKAPCRLQPAVSSSLLGSSGLLEPELSKSQKLMVKFSRFCKLVDITLVV